MAMHVIRQHAAAFMSFPPSVKSALVKSLPPHGELCEKNENGHSMHEAVASFARVGYSDKQKMRWCRLSANALIY